MRHKRRVKHFSRESGPRKALFRGLVLAVIEHGRIKTTLAKAKEIRRHVEKAVTIGKEGTLANRRVLISKLANSELVGKLMTEISPRFKERNGGYTRIIKIGRRPGDTAEMAFLEFVDYDWEANQKSKDAAEASKAKPSKKAKAGAKDAPVKAKKAVSKKTVVKAKKKVLRKIQATSRREARV